MYNVCVCFQESGCLGWVMSIKVLYDSVHSAALLVGFVDRIRKAVSQQRSRLAEANPQQLSAVVTDTVHNLQLSHS